VPVTTSKVAEMSLPDEVQGVGNVEAFSTVEIRSQVTGPLLSVEFAEGDDVTEGQLLFTIDGRPFDTALRQAQSALAKDTATLTNQEVVLKRYDDLLQRGLMAKADRDTYAAGVASLRETLNADQAQVENAKLQLQYTKITAPIAGRTGALQVHKGSLVRTGDALPMVVINQITPVRVTFSLPASNLPRIQAGQAKAPLKTEAVPSGDVGSSTGVLSFIDNSVDPATAAIRLKATFPNKDRRLWPGEFVRVRLEVAVDPHALVIPAGAVQDGAQGQIVYVVNANRTVAMRPVKVLRSAGDNVVIAEGLQAGEEVVTDGQLRLTPGARISIRPPAGGRP
jgi:multidrug efflux system membrane fusion protein